MLKMSNQLISFLIDENTDKFVLDIVVKVSLLFVVTMIFLRIGKWLLNHLLSKDNANRKQRTLVPVVYQVYRALVLFIAGCIALPFFGISATPLVAISSSLGLIIGIGAQQTIRDLISGFFILSENQFNVGDLVTVAQERGVVLEIGLRTTILKSSTSGERIIVPNSLITVVHNASVSHVSAKAEIAVPNTIDVTSFIDSLSEQLKDIYDEVIMDSIPQLIGITKMDHLSTSVLVQVNCKPKDKLKVESLIKVKMREILDNQNK